jgi:hypothetical protein
MPRYAKVILGVAAIAATLAAQPDPRRKRGAGREGPELGPAAIQFMNMEMSARQVKGAPYSANAVYETNQALADGNRIHRTTTVRIYRDGEGRTRREQSFSALAPPAPASVAEAVFIMDPVAGVNYVLDQQRRTVHKSATGKRPTRHEPGGSPSDAVRRPAPAPDIAGLPHDRKAKPAGHTASTSNVKKEDLGTRTIEGVQALGSRTVTTIPAGEIGNERPIEIVSERWYSPDLQVVVLSRHNDPRMGEITYRLTSVSRTEPPHSLFEPPADYTSR